MAAGCGIRRSTEMICYYKRRIPIMKTDIEIAQETNLFLFATV